MTTRTEILEEMRELAEHGIDCSACCGTCCTFVANSMQIEETEARAIADHLRENRAELAAWRARLQDTVTRFSLDRPPASDGRRQLTRRRYTCTFFQDPGCALPLAVKPLGCLAFNPRHPGQTEGGDCETRGVPSQTGEARPIPVAVLAALSLTREND